MDGCNGCPPGLFCINNSLLALLAASLACACYFAFPYLVPCFVAMAKDMKLAEDMRASDDQPIHQAPSHPPPSHPRSRQTSNILDSCLDDIQVPSLQPQLANTMSISLKIEQKENRLPVHPTKLFLDARLDNLAIPALEPNKEVSSLYALPTTTPRQLDLVKAFCLILGKDPITVARFSANSDGHGNPNVVHWDGQIRWALKGCSIFDNVHEEYDALTFPPNMLARQPIGDLWMFQYGVRYIPSRTEKNCYRTVRIEGIPAGLDLKHILPAIQGEIYSARLFDTGAIIGSNTAIVTFVWQTDAVRFLHGSKYGIRVGFVSVNVIPVNTPTYPMPVEMDKLVFEQGYTRCICVHSLRVTVKAELHRILKRSPHYNYVESIEDGQVVGDIYIRFHSIKTAATVLNLLKGHPSFPLAKYRFLKQDRESHVSGIESQSSIYERERRRQV